MSKEIHTTNLPFDPEDSDVCWRCMGDGQMSRPLIDPDEFEEIDDDIITCEVCLGKGRVP